MLADIAHGHVDGADVLFLIAVVVFVVAALLSVLETAAARFHVTLAYVGLALTALAWLLL